MRARLLNMDVDDSMYSEYEEDDRFENFMKEVKFSGKQQKNENFNFLEEKTQESFIKLFHKKKITASNSFEVEIVKIKQILENEEGEIDTLDEKWRKCIEILNCNATLYGLRTENFKLTLQKVFEELEKNKKGKPKKNGELPSIIEETDEEKDLTFKEGRETLAKQTDLELDRGLEGEFAKDPTIDLIKSEIEKNNTESIFMMNLQISENMEYIFDFSANEFKPLTTGSTSKIDFENFKFRTETKKSKLEPIKEEPDEELTPQSGVFMITETIPFKPNEALIGDIKEGLKSEISTLNFFENLSFHSKYSCLKPQYSKYKLNKVKSEILYSKNFTEEELQGMDLQCNSEGSSPQNPPQIDINTSFDLPDPMENIEQDFFENNSENIFISENKPRPGFENNKRYSNSEDYFSRAKRIINQNDSLFRVNSRTGSKLTGFASFSFAPENWMKNRGGKSSRKFKKILAKKKNSKGRVKKGNEKLFDEEMFFNEEKFDFSLEDRFKKMDVEIFFENFPEFEIQNPVKMTKSKLKRLVDDGIQAIEVNKKYISHVPEYYNFEFGKIMKSLFTKNDTSSSMSNLLRRIKNSENEIFNSVEFGNEDMNFNQENDFDDIDMDNGQSQLDNFDQRIAKKFSKKNLKINELKELINDHYLIKIENSDQINEETDLRFSKIFSELTQNYLDEDEKSINPHVIFLTVLHLINEKGLYIEMIDHDKDFKIFLKKPKN